MEHTKDKWHRDGASHHAWDTRLQQPSSSGHVNGLITQNTHHLFLQEPSEEVPEATWVTRFAQAAASSWVPSIRMGKKWKTSSLPCSLPAGSNSNTIRELMWQPRRYLPALCFPNPRPSCCRTPRSPFPSLHEVPPCPPCPRLDQEQHHTWVQHPAPAAPSILALAPIPKTGVSSALAEGVQQSTCWSASALSWICSTGAPKKTFV